MLLLSEMLACLLKHLQSYSVYQSAYLSDTISYTRYSA